MEIIMNMKTNRNLRNSFIFAAALAGLACAPAQGMWDASIDAFRIFAASMVGYPLDQLPLKLEHRPYSANSVLIRNSAIALLVTAGISYAGYSLYSDYTENLLSRRLYNAANAGDLEQIISLLKQNGYTLNSYPNSLKFLEQALYLKQFRLANALVNNGLDIQDYCKNTLHSSQFAQNIPRLKYAIKKCNSLNTKNDFGFTPLHHAAFNGNLEYVKIFVQSGADITIKHAHQFLMDLTAYDIAIAENKATVANYLKLVHFYVIERMQNTVPEFLQELNFEQRQDILDIALAQAHGSTLQQFNKLNPKIYSWTYMLALAAEQDFSAPVSFLMAQLMAFPTKNTTQLIKEIYNDAKINDKADFGKAMFDFYKTARTLTGPSKDNTTLPKDAVLKITEFI